MKLLKMLLFLTSTICACQDYVVTYEKYLESDGEILAEPGLYNLKISNGKSSFRSKNTTDYRYLNNDIQSLSHALNGKSTVSYEMRTKELTQDAPSFTGGKVLVYETENTIWNITKQQRKINGITCFKATGLQGKSANFKGSFVTVWFAPSIPLSTGPSGFVGLPGLVLLAHDERGYTLSVKEILKKEKGAIVIDKLPDLPKMSKAALEEKVMKLMKEYKS